MNETPPTHDVPWLMVHE